MISSILALSLSLSSGNFEYPVDAHELGKGNHRTLLFYHNPPDPVNVRTLNFFFPATHLTMPCWVSIEIKAAYNSYSGDESVFGKKWTFNHNVFVREAITQIEVVEGDGFVNAYTRERNLEESNKNLVQSIIVNLKKDDAMNKKLKPDVEYKEIEKRLLSDKIYRQQMAKTIVRSARPLGPGEYFSLSRSPSSLVKMPDGSYERRHQNGAKEIFNKQGKLIKSQDRNGNFLSYIYQENNLSKITDMCGRSVEFSYYSTPAARGLVRSISDSMGRTLTYTYDGSRQLISYIDSEKATHEFRYDKRGNVVEYKNSSDAQSNFLLTYNETQEVKSQIGPQTNKSEYNRSFVANDPNHSITQIQKFIANELASREVHEFKLSEFESVTKFDKAGKELSKIIKKFSKQTGYPTSILDARGEGDVFEYDSIGNLISRENVVNQGGSVVATQKLAYTYDPKCNQVSGVKTTKRGVPARDINYKFDARCNVIEAIETLDGKQVGWVLVEHGPQGKPKFLTDKQTNQQIAFTYWNYGKAESITLRDLGTILVKYKENGDILDTKFKPHGKGEAKFKGQGADTYNATILREVRQTLDAMLGLLRPAGLNIGL